jgi:radical SAM superfamily enzyme YgiQ (UPF0313 family)
MAKALLINPSYFRTYGSSEGGIAFPVYPILSLSAVGGALKARGHEITILDLSYREYDPKTIRELIVRERFDAVGITATTPLANQMRDISFLVKDISSSILTVGGGAHPSALPFETMKESCLDAVVAGEGDFALADILDGRSLADVPGLYWRRNGEIRSNPAGPLIENLDDLPMPAWEDYPPEGNRMVTRLIARFSPVSTIEFSRGCVFKCDFCGSKNTMGLGYRKKSPERCAEELARLQALGFREVVLVDDIFTSDKEWAAKVCEAIIRRGVKMAWTCTNGIRVDSANPTLFGLMKRAGCYRVYFGFESGNEEVIRAFGKGGRATLSKGLEAVAMARDAGLEPNGFFMVGLSGDSEASMQDTINYARQVELDTMKCGMATPYPGTPMFDSLRRAGRIKTFDWDQYTVYNKADAIYDHPTLTWDTIKRYFDKFYVEAYFKNPRYIWRRFLFMLRNHEIYWNVFYAAKFWLLLRRGNAPAEHERYEFEPVWRKLDTKLDDQLGAYPVPVALSGRSRRIALTPQTPR